MGINLEDDVVSKQTGLPGVGRVCGIVIAPLYCVIKHINKEENYWKTLYPDWFYKYVFYVAYSELRYTMSFQEYKSGWLSTFGDTSNEELKVLYKYSQKQTTIAYPEDDLEIFDKV